MSQNPNAISWFEIYVDDMERAKKFYSAVLGVTFQDVPSHKTKISIGEYGFCAICLDTEGNTFGLHSLQ